MCWMCQVRQSQITETSKTPEVKVAEPAQAANPVRRREPDPRLVADEPIRRHI